MLHNYYINVIKVLTRERTALIIPIMCKTAEGTDA